MVLSIFKSKLDRFQSRYLNRTSYKDFLHYTLGPHEILHTIPTEKLNGCC